MVFIAAGMGGGTGTGRTHCRGDRTCRRSAHCRRGHTTVSI
jgi:hypothetical protein